MNSIKSKIVLANLVVFGFLISGLAYFVHYRTARSELAVIDSRLEACGAKVFTEFEDEWEEEADPEWDDILDISVEGLHGVSMSLRDTTGLVVFANDSFPALSPLTVQEVISGSMVNETVARDGREFRQAVVPVEIDGIIEFTLTLATPIEDVSERLGRLALILSLAVGVVLLLASIAVYIVTRSALAPMTRMIETAEEISGESLDRRVEVPGSRDEVARLSVALNSMMDRIEAAFSSQRQFVTDASHELRTPITVIIGELEFLQKKVDREKSGALDTALTELDRLSRLVDQLLTLARIDARRLGLEKIPTRLDELIVECVKLLHKESNKRGIAIELNIEEAAEIQADPMRLKSIILNLLDNALRFSNEGGVVTVSLMAVAEGMAELTVSDRGPGIAAVDRPRVFERFFRSSSARATGNGSGLGLAIVRELVELYGGSIRAEDCPEGGYVIRG